MVEPRVASGECGGGLGAVAPAVGEDGPQHDATEVTVVLPLATAAAGESPTTSISSSSSTSMLGSSARSGHG